jgi:hypothetical protein
MKHHVYALLLCISFSLCAESDNHIADKSKRIGRFSYEDSFDESLVEKILKHAPSAVKKNIKRLLYPSESEDIPQRLLLLGGTSNAVTAAIAKTMALRCGYEYYVINAAALLREYREGRQMLLSEVRPIIKSGKPIALIITELPEMADYSGLLASTLWLLIDQCAQYEDVLVIGTSAFEKEKLSEDVKERFGKNIVPVVLDKALKKQIEKIEIVRNNWFQRNKEACIFVGSLMFFMLAATHVGAQILFASIQTEREAAKLLLKENKMTTYDSILKVEKDLQERQREQITLQHTIIELQNNLRNLIENNVKDEKQKLGDLQTKATSLIQKAERIFSYFKIPNV